ncbi:uncharacterized protein LOC144169751 isoform X2 [Haemaphysalis longicornis]
MIEHQSWKDSVDFLSSLPPSATSAARKKLQEATLEEARDYPGCKVFWPLCSRAEVDFLDSKLLQKVVPGMS